MFGFFKKFCFIRSNKNEMPGNKNKFQKSCARLFFSYFFVKSKKKEVRPMPTHSRPTWTKREKGGKNQDIVSYFFRVYIRLWIWFVPSRKKRKKVRQEIENSSGDLTLSRCCCSIRTHTTFNFFQTTQRNVPRHHKNISQLSLSPEPTTTTTTTTSNSM